MWCWCISCLQTRLYEVQWVTDDDACCTGNVAGPEVCGHDSLVFLCVPIGVWEGGGGENYVGMVGARLVLEEGVMQGLWRLGEWGGEGRGRDFEDLLVGQPRLRWM